MKEHDSEFESNNLNSVTESEQSQVNVAASVADNADGAVVEDVEHPNIEDESESALLTKIEREEYQEKENFDTKFEKEPSPVEEDEMSAVIDLTKTLLWLK